MTRNCVLLVLLIVSLGAAADDRVSLTEFYVSTNGDQWTRNEGWLDPIVPICQWHGVECWEGEPVRLTLSDNGLTGGFDPSLLPRSLTVLDLSDNALEGIFDPSLLPPGLSQIDLSNNALSGEFDTDWLFEFDLFRLDLSGNRLTGELDERLLEGDFGFDLPNPEIFAYIDLCWNELSVSSEAVWDWLDTYNRGGNARLCFGAQRTPLSIDQSGSWFDPERAGEGTTLHFLDDGNALIYWFTYDYNLGQRWFFGQLGPVDFERTDLDFSMLSPILSGTTDGGWIQDGFRQGGLHYDRLGDGSMGTLQTHEVNLSISGFEPWPLGLRQEHQRLSQVAGTNCEDPDLPALSGLWHHPDIDLDGFVVEVLPNGSAVVYWFTWETLPSGSPRQAWMIGQADLVIAEDASQPHRLDMDPLFRPVGTRWGPRFDADEIELEDWGRLSLEFYDEMNARVTFEARVEGFESASYPLQRLARTRQADCD